MEAKEGQSLRANRTWLKVQHFEHFPEYERIEYLAEIPLIRARAYQEFKFDQSSGEGCVNLSVDAKIPLRADYSYRALTTFRLRREGHGGGLSLEWELVEAQGSEESQSAFADGCLRISDKISIVPYGCQVFNPLLMLYSPLYFSRESYGEMAMFATSKKTGVLQVRRQLDSNGSHATLEVGILRNHLSFVEDEKSQKLEFDKDIVSALWSKNSNHFSELYFNINKIPRIRVTGHLLERVLQK